MVFMQIDVEEAKGQEISKLRNALLEMQVQLEEAHAAIIREKEAAKIAIAQAPPVLKEVPVVDNTKMDLLKNQNEELEVTSYNLFLAYFITNHIHVLHLGALSFWF